MAGPNELETATQFKCFGKEIEKLNGMAKKPAIEDDLIGVLDKFLLKLRESEMYLAEGIFKVNFSEAALLLQSAADVYGKKVGLLWDFILAYQHRIMQQNENEVTEEQVRTLEERLNRDKRKKKKVVEIGQTSQAQNSRNEYRNKFLLFKKMLSKVTENVERHEGSWEELIEQQNEVEVSDSEDDAAVLESPSDIILPHEQPRQKLYTDIRLYTHSLLPPRYVKISSDIPGQDEYIAHDKLQTLNYDLYNRCSIDLFNSLGSEEHVQYVPLLGRDKLPYFSEKFADAADCSSPIIDHSSVGSTRTNLNISVNVTRLDENTLRKYLEKSNTTDSSDVNVNDTAPETCDSHNSPETQEEYTPSKRHTTFDSGFFESSRSEGCFSGESGTFKSSEVISSTPKRRRNMSDYFEEVGTNVKVRKKVHVESTLKNTTASFKEFENFFVSNYIPEEDEGVIMDFSDVDDYLEDRITDEEVSTDGGAVEPCESRKFVIETGPREDALARQQYLEWKKMIHAQVGNMEDPKTFDIHQYGTEIIESFPETKVVKFSSFVKGKSPSEVCKYFVASLQLANTLNIKFQNVPAGKVANDCLEMELISKERHHEKLLHFQAPSEEALPRKISLLRSTSSVHMKSNRFSGIKRPSLQSEVASTSSCSKFPRFSTSKEHSHLSLLPNELSTSPSTPKQPSPTSLDELLSLPSTSRTDSSKKIFPSPSLPTTSMCPSSSKVPEEITYKRYSPQPSRSCYDTPSSSKKKRLSPTRCKSKKGSTSTSRELSPIPSTSKDFPPLPTIPREFCSSTPSTSRAYAPSQTRSRFSPILLGNFFSRTTLEAFSPIPSSTSNVSCATPSTSGEFSTLPMSPSTVRDHRFKRKR